MAKPDWTRDELILALDLYFREPSARGSKSHPAVIELSALLNKLSIHDKHGRDTDFRNANGVGMKLSNFLRLDPSYKGEGLKRGSHLEEQVWDSFSGDRDRLEKVAAAIRLNMTVVKSGGGRMDDFEEDEAEEGSVLTRVHRFRERNRQLVDKKKRQVLKGTGQLACEVCGFIYASTYGSLGEGFAECHHTKPISDLKPNEKTRLSDLAIVCANCHRMLHRRRPWPSVEELRVIREQTIQQQHASQPLHAER